MALLCRWPQYQYAKRPFCGCRDCNGAEHGCKAKLPGAQKQREIHAARLVAEVANWDRASISGFRETTDVPQNGE